MDLGLEGRKALIWASREAIRLVCAEILPNKSSTIIIHIQRRLETIANRNANQYYVTLKTVAADVSTEIGRQTLFEACTAPDKLVKKNAGLSARDFRQLSEDETITGRKQYMLTPIAFLNSVIGTMAKKHFAPAVNIASTAFYSPKVRLVLSSGAPAGLTDYVANIANSFASCNIRIADLLQEAFLTGWLKKSAQKTAQVCDLANDAVLEKRRTEKPTQQFRQAAEFDDGWAFFVRDAGYTTAQNLNIEGRAYSAF